MFNLYDGAVLLLITGRIGISILCNFNCALNVGGDGFFCVKYFICLLSMIILHNILNILKGICASSWTFTKNHCMMHSQQNVKCSEYVSVKL